LVVFVIKTKDSSKQGKEIEIDLKGKIIFIKMLMCSIFIKEFKKHINHSNVCEMFEKTKRHKFLNILNKLLITTLTMTLFQ